MIKFSSHAEKAGCK